MGILLLYPVYKSSFQAEMDVLRNTHSDLIAGREKLERMIADLEKEKVKMIVEIV